MFIGVPKEVKNHEYRVGATPAFVQTLVEAGHKVTVETQAGAMIGFTDAMYQEAGALIASGPEEVYAQEMIIKVKEPQRSEFPLLREGQLLFCYLHLSAEPLLTQTLLEKKVVTIAYETVEDHLGRLPLLLPMSEIAGRLSIQVGMTALQMNHGGKGILLGGVPGVLPANVVILGGGIAGGEAARIAMGLEADVTVFDKNLARLRELDFNYGPRIKTVFATSRAIEEALCQADLVVGAVLIPGKLAPRVVTKNMLARMPKKSVMVDISIDQGGCFETSRPTTHSDPTYRVDGIIHYCVTNMPGACAKTSTLALTNATLQYALQIAKMGWKEAVQSVPGLLPGLNTALGHVTHPAVAQDLGYDFTPPKSLV